MSGFWTAFVLGAAIAAALILWLFWHFIVGLIVLAIKLFIIVVLVIAGLVFAARRLLKRP